MSTEMNIGKIIADIDALLKAGEDARAEERLIEAIAEYTKAEPRNKVGQSVLLNELGGFYRSRGILGKGEEAYLKAKDLLEQMSVYAYIADDCTEVSDRCSCNALSYDNLCREKEDKEHRIPTEIVFANESLMANYATTLNNLAGLYRMGGQFQKAIATFDAAIKVYENCEGGVSPDHFASGYNNKGLVYLDMHDLGNARSMFLKAEEILANDENNKYALGTTLSNLGLASVIEKKYSEATELFRKAKALFEEAVNCEMAQNCEGFLSKLEARS